MATEYFKAQGWSAKDVGAKESFDLLLSRGDERCRAEVKGTTSAGKEVILTRAEAETQRTYYPHTALVVVHSIEMDRTEASRRPAAASCNAPAHGSSTRRLDGDLVRLPDISRQAGPDEDLGKPGLFPPHVPNKGRGRQKAQVNDDDPGPLWICLAAGRERRFVLEPAESWQAVTARSGCASSVLDGCLPHPTLGQVSQSDMLRCLVRYVSCRQS
ncbi:protein NO VEIN domain-containing protein [Streptomyces sp. SudanB91_2054]|uniref:protein NO VEIN domain-containing protein n=1 Tax=Streptomyces sp. SudanB91_2054 TaxID=3035278 RepID=UPI0036DA16DD